jgi:hypothetical protein
VLGIEAAIVAGIICGTVFELGRMIIDPSTCTTVVVVDAVDAFAVVALGAIGLAVSELAGPVVAARLAERNGTHADAHPAVADQPRFGIWICHQPTT